MPSRYIRDGILSSARVNALSMGAEVLYRRLMSVVDDYGRYHGGVVTLRGACWPTKSEVVRASDVSRWLTELLVGDQPLVRMYNVDGAAYLEIQNFRQVTRSKSKFPDPPWYAPAGSPQTNVCNPPANANDSPANVHPIRERERISRTRTRASEAKRGKVEAGETRTLTPTPPKGLPDPGCEDFGERFKRLYQQHVVTGFFAEGRIRYLELITSAVNPATVADSVDAKHAEWMAYFRARPDSYKPSISRWFEDQYHLRSPAKDGPKKQSREAKLDEVFGVENVSNQEVLGS